MRRNARRKNESGFALLLVFAMAAAVMVMLYLEMPRVAFEYQRNKEGLLVERGEQYTRAIALYYRKFAKLPQNLDELESTNNLRFLRKRYTDPMTGKDEWRLVHVDAAGQYVDSLVHKRQGQEEKKGPSALAATIQGIGSQAEYTPGLGGDQEKNPALQRRASDRVAAGTPGAPGSGESGDNEQSPEDGRSAPPGAPNQNEGAPGQSGTTPPGSTAAPPSIQSPGGAPQPGAPGVPGSVVPGQPGSTNPQQGATPGTSTGASSGGGFGFSGGFGNSAPTTGAGQAGTGQAGSTTPGGQPTIPPSQTGNNPFSPTSPFTQGQQRPPVQDGTMRAISTMITGQQQRPGTATGGGVGTGGLGGSMPGAGGTGGLVGVASKADYNGILVYNEKTNIKEWEFLFDMKQAAQAAANQQNGAQGQNPLQQNQSNQSNRPGGGNPFGTMQNQRPAGRP